MFGINLMAWGRSDATNAEGKHIREMALYTYIWGRR